MEQMPILYAVQSHILLGYFSRKIMKLHQFNAMYARETCSYYIIRIEIVSSSQQFIKIIILLDTKIPYVGIRLCQCKIIAPKIGVVYVCSFVLNHTSIPSIHTQMIKSITYPIFIFNLQAHIKLLRFSIYQYRYIQNGVAFRSRCLLSLSLSIPICLFGFDCEIEKRKKIHDARIKMINQLNFEYFYCSSIGLSRWH